MNKKGLSDVITNVLIIVLVIVAIGIIAAFVMPLLNRSASQANEGVSCLTVNVAPVSCTYVATTGVPTVGFNRGAGKYDLESVSVVVRKADGTSTPVAISVANLAKLVEFATVNEAFSSVAGVSTSNLPVGIRLAVKLRGNAGSCPQTPEFLCSAA